MFVDYAQTRIPAPSRQVWLEAIWLLEADPSYSVDVRHLRSENHIVLRTLQGSGLLQFTTGEEIRTAPGILACFRHEEIRHYGCLGPAWHFRWYTFQPAGRMPLRCKQLIDIPEHAEEASISSECIRLLRGGSPESLALASALFGVMWGRWLLEAENRERSLSRMPDLRKALALIAGGMKPTLSVEELAAAVNLSPRRFHDVFRQQTGMTPGKFMEETRIRRAEELLSYSALSIGEIAEILGYASPFHFSFAFRKSRDMPPSAWRHKQGISVNTPPAGRKRE